MRRVQFIELHEQGWFPQSIRDEITDMLEFGLNLSNAYASAAPLLQRALRSTRSHLVIDLCSGGGGPWAGISRKIQGNARALEVCLTDKYPNLKAFEKTEAMSGDITCYPESVDATNVPPELKGFRTMFTSFHHFPREEALAILRSSVDAGQGIGIFEITRRSPVTISLMFLWALAPFVFTPFVRPFRWSRLLWTYVIPDNSFCFAVRWRGLLSANISPAGTNRPNRRIGREANIIGKQASIRVRLPKCRLLT